MSRGRPCNGYSPNRRESFEAPWCARLTSALKTDIRIGTRVDKEISKGGNLGKVSRVEEILAKDQKA